MGGSVVSVFHSGVDDTDDSISIVKEHWSGPIAAYPEAGRRDYVDRFQDVSSENEMNPDGYLEMAKKWVGEGVQIIGGCCGMGVDYITPLRAGLPEKITAPRAA